MLFLRIHKYESYVWLFVLVLLSVRYTIAIIKGGGLGALGDDSLHFFAVVEL